ncbi:heavy-metal-associated domain-containing protein [Altererythrobacter sp. CC-YST694]|uniref:heavy-metal-associated domain-containing protein n=1 Tax=Altererythrobacter sp. CC-YST694 TaxID=2755038 RepID=UPI001D03178B|nr:heavy-metal-associated domain-containing protein [Altererythrobacter sp. CC-YST694]
MDRSASWPASWIAALGALGLTIAAGTALIAQVSGDRGIAPVASSTDISIGGIEVNASGRNAEDARKNGWLQAERKAWEKLGGPKMSDSVIDSMVSAIVIESEQIGPRRYIARLGVVFDRTKAGPLLGGQGGPAVRSAPLLTIPVLNSGGTYTVYEVRNEWQRAWAEYQAGRSAIDYVRPSGAGGDSLLVNYGQLGRRSRSWWRNVLDAYGAADVIVPVAHLERQWPGGPVKGTFTARFGPDDKFIESFTLSARSEDEVPAMLNKAIQRFDQIYTAALLGGKLRPDPTLRTDRLTLDPKVAALIAAERDAQSADAAAAAAAAALAVPMPSETAPAQAPAAQAVNSFVVQFTTPSAPAVDSALASVRGTPGVRGAATSSIAIGGVSVMRVSYGGDLGALAAALRSRGWSVTQSGNSLTISR